MLDGNTFVNLFDPPSTSDTESSSSQYVDPSNMHTFFNHILMNIGGLRITLWNKMEASRIFLAYAAHKLFIVFQMDVKNAFLHGTLKEDIYVCQPEGFIDVDHPSHVYRLKKAVYGLKQASRAWEIKAKLDLDKKGTLVDATKYHSMIGALMYLTSSRPDIDSGFELTKFLDADYARCKDTFKSTSGGAQFLAKKMDRLPTGRHIHQSPSNRSFQLSGSSPWTDYQLADIFTKALPTDRFNYLVRRLGMHILSSKELERLAKSY
nr:integrase, catalytic region, zinc finger, CCHC-type, peptidase aspartic, catalytic [Tanacetum cinerariifolium]